MLISLAYLFAYRSFDMDISEVKRNLNQIVIYHSDFGELKFKLTGCTLRKDNNNNYFYQAEIMDLKAKHSLTICDLNKISAIKKCDGVKNI